MRNTLFGEVLAELLEERGMRVKPFAVGKMAEDAGLDGWKAINRMASADAPFAGELDGLAARVDLTEPEMTRLLSPTLSTAVHPSYSGERCSITYRPGWGILIGYPGLRECLRSPR